MIKFIVFALVCICISAAVVRFFEPVEPDSRESTAAYITTNPALPFQNRLNISQPSLAESIARGKKVYETYCLACHQADGTGVPRLNPPLVKTSFVLGDKKTLIGIVLNGFDEQIEIDGDTFSNVMASHDFLKDQEIADVLTYVRNSFGNKAAAVSPAEVAAVRAAQKK
jgi:mono/diheme cytochrome c family protein